MLDQKTIDPALFDAVVNRVRPFAERRGTIGTISEAIDASIKQAQIISAIEKQYGKEFAQRVNGKMIDIRIEASYAPERQTENYGILGNANAGPGFDWSSLPDHKDQ